jgi:hypothetical protein
MLVDGETSRGWNGDEGDSGDRKWGRSILLWSLGFTAAGLAAVGGVRVAQGMLDHPIKMPSTFRETQHEKNNRIFVGPRGDVDQVDCGGSPVILTHEAAAQAYLASHIQNGEILSVEGGQAAVRCFAPLTRAVVRLEYPK